MSLILFINSVIQIPVQFGLCYDGCMNALLIHGWGTKAEFYDPTYPTASNSHWFPWLTKELMIRDIHTVAVEMPNSFNPEYEVWKNELERFELNEDTILVGHSCGGGFIVRYLSENNIKVGKVLLVAPWIGIEPDRDFDELFFDFVIDPDLVSKTAGITILSSVNDYKQIRDSVRQLTYTLKDAKHIEFKDKGHFTFNDLGSQEFPELLEAITD